MKFNLPWKNQNNKKTKNSEKRSTIYGVMPGRSLEDAIKAGYTPLNKNPEVVSACRIIANLISSMTIHLVSQGKNGSERIINALSRKIDIEPCKNMTRRAWMDTIVMNLLLYGNGNSYVLPVTKNGYLDQLIPVPANMVTTLPTGLNDYKVVIGGIKFDPQNLVHITLNPDQSYHWKGAGITVCLKDVVNNISQARATEKAFMSSKWKPSVIVKVDALIDEFSSPEGRKRLLDEYMLSSEAGEPWLIPSEQFSVDTVRPLTLADLAINDTVKIDKKTVAAIMGVPSFILGEGTYTDAEWNNFIASYVRPIAQSIEQELSKKLIISENWYFRFNIQSLFNYDLEKLSNVCNAGIKASYITRNEAREKLGWYPVEGGDEFIVLENYISINDIANQKKLSN